MTRTAPPFIRRGQHRSLCFLSGVVSIVLSACPAHSHRSSQGQLWKEFSGEKAFVHVQRLVELDLVRLDLRPSKNPGRTSRINFDWQVGRSRDKHSVTTRRAEKLILLILLRGFPRLAMSRHRSCCVLTTTQRRFRRFDLLVRMMVVPAPACFWNWRGS